MHPPPHTYFPSATSRVPQQCVSYAQKLLEFWTPRIPRVCNYHAITVNLAICDGEGCLPKNFNDFVLFCFVIVLFWFCFCEPLDSNDIIDVGTPKPREKPFRSSRREGMYRKLNYSCKTNSRLLRWFEEFTTSCKARGAFKYCKGYVENIGKTGRYS